MNLLSFLWNGFDFMVVSGFTRHGFCTISSYYDIEVTKCCTVKKEFSGLYYVWKGRTSKSCISLDILITKNSSCSKEITVPWIYKCFLGIKTVHGVNHESQLNWKIWAALLPPKAANPSESICLFSTCVLVYQNIFWDVFCQMLLGHYRCRCGKKCLEKLQMRTLPAWRKRQKASLIVICNHHRVFGQGRLLIFSVTVTVLVSTFSSLNVTLLSSIQNCSVSVAMYHDVNTELLDILYVIYPRITCLFSQGHLIILW